MNNAQSFSMSSDQYARSRPTYPDELFAFLSSTVERRESAWDCATGTGQAAVSCARHFSHIEATDLSSEQIQQCRAHPQITYRVCPAEETPFADNSFDLISVAQAFHWFDQPRFFREAERVLRPGGVLAVFGYAFFEINPEMDALIREHLLAPIDPFWAHGNRILMSGYAGVELPFERIPVSQDFAIQVEWTLPQLLAYVQTWSAVKRYIAETGRNPAAGLEARLAPFWGESEKILPVRMPLFLKTGRKR